VTQTRRIVFSRLADKQALALSDRERTLIEVSLGERIEDVDAGRVGFRCDADRKEERSAGTLLQSIE
jgi:hypothetical protein